MIARGEVEARAFPEHVALTSPLPGIADAAWTRFVRACAQSALGAVTDSNALGMFEMMPRRLADFGFVENLKRVKAPSGRMVWVGDFVAPLTCEAFLHSPKAQYNAFTSSMADYAARIWRGVVEKPADVSLSGALALLHRLGPQGLESWQKGKRFEATRVVFERAQGIF